MVAAMTASHPSHLQRRAAMHAALSEPLRLAFFDDLAASDRSPRVLADRHGLPTNLLAHHLDVLEEVGFISRGASSGDGRRKYVRLVHDPLVTLTVSGAVPRGRMLFLCSHNSARSQLAAALWTSRTGQSCSSAGTHPADRVHPGAVAAARRIGLSLDGAEPVLLGAVGRGVQVVTVCDRAHEELDPAADWWHWSIPDPVERGTRSAFDDVVADLGARIDTILSSGTDAS